MRIMKLTAKIDYSGRVITKNIIYNRYYFLADLTEESFGVEEFIKPIPVKLEQKELCVCGRYLFSFLQRQMEAHQPNEVVMIILTDFVPRNSQFTTEIFEDV